MVTTRFARLLSGGRMAASLATALAMVLLPVSPLTLLSLSMADASSGSVVINEFVSDPSSGSNEWVELYNATNSSVNLSGWTLEDTGPHTLSLSGSVAAHKFASFDFSGSVLNNGSDTITLRDASDAVIDSVAYGTASGAIVAAPGSGQSAGRAPDGSDNWVIFSTPSKDASNDNGAIEFTPAPPASVDIGNTLSFMATSNDLANPTYAVSSDVSVSPLGDSLSIDKTTGAFSWTSSAYDLLTAPTFTITATEGSYSESKTFSESVGVGVPGVSNVSDNLAVQSTSTPVGSPVTLLATLTGSFSGTSIPLSGEKVGFSVNGSSLGTSTADANGVATYTYTPSLSAGTYTIMAYSTPPLFDSVSGTGALTISPSTPACDVNGENGTNTAIQDAINAASAGDTITVCAGTYPENVTIDKSITLEGANAGVDPNVDTRKSESIISGSITVKASNVTVSGFTIDPSSGSSVTMQGAYTGETVKDNIIDDNGYAVNFNTGTTFITNNLINYGANPTTGIEANSNPGNDIHVSYNHFSGNAAALPADVTIIGGTTRSEDVFIANNTSTSGTTLASVFNSRDVSITSNSTTGAQGSAIYIGGNDSYVNVTGNTIASAVDAIHVANDFKDGSNDNVTVSKNQIATSNAAGLTVDPGAYTASSAVAATGNWWGSTTGPTDTVSGDGSIPDTNPGGTGSSALGAVAYGSWCTDASCSTLYNPTPSAPSGLYFTQKGQTLTNDETRDGTDNLQLRWNSAPGVTGYDLAWQAPDGTNSGGANKLLSVDLSNPYFSIVNAALHSSLLTHGNGLYTFSIYAVENGVRSTSSSTISLIYDTRTPTVQFTSPVASSSVDITAPVTVTGTYQEQGLAGISRIQLYASKGYKYDYNQHAGYVTATLAKHGTVGTFTGTFTASQLAALGATAGDPITFTAVPIDNVGNGERSSNDWKDSSVTAVVGSPLPAAPTNLYAKFQYDKTDIPDSTTLNKTASTTGNNLLIGWAAPSGTVTGYHILVTYPDGTTKTAYQGPNNWTWLVSQENFGSQEGKYTFQVEAVNKNGASAPSTPFTLSYDTKSPTAQFTAPLPPEYVNGNFTVSGTASDNVALKNVFFDVRDSSGWVAGCVSGTQTTTWTNGSTTADTSCTISTANLTEGYPYILRIHAGDYAGYGSAGQQQALILDTTRPDATITSPVDNSTQPGSFTVTGTATDTLSGIDHVNIYVSKVDDSKKGDFGGYAVDDQPATWDAGTDAFIYPVSGLADGTYTIKADAFDKAGNDHFANTVTITVQNTTPVFVTTDAASNVTPLDAILNGTNGTSDASQVSFWISTSTFATSSAQIPANVYSSVPTDNIPAGADFSTALSSLVTKAYVHGQTLGVMPVVMPDTTYYYVAWSNVNGTWHAGTEQSFTTELAAPIFTNPSVSGLSTTTAGWKSINWLPVLSSNSPVTYTYEVSNSDATNTDGSFSSPIAGATHTGITGTSLPTPGTPPGTYFFHLMATDAVNNTSPWSTPMEVIVNNSGSGSGTGGGTGGTGGTTPTSYATTTVVDEGDLAANWTDAAATPTEWFFENDATNAIDNNLGQFVQGPTGALGNGSAQISINGASQGTVLGTLAYSGIPLSDIKTLSYETYRSAGDPADALALQFDVATATPTATTPYEGRLVFEPYLTGATVQTNAWQNWNALTGAGWWFSHAASSPASGKIVTTCTEAAPCTLSQVLTQFPNIQISGGLYFKAGSGWQSFTGNVDDFVIETNDGTQDTTATYDFEPTQTPVLTVTNKSSLESAPSTVGDPVTVQWTLAPQSGYTGVPTGAVNVYVNGTGKGSLACTESVSANQCSFTPSSAGSLQIYVGYGSNSPEFDSISPQGPITHTVNASSGGGTGAGTGGTGGGGNGAPVSLVGDLNHDGHVNFLDFAILVANMGKKGANIADLNGDDIVNAADLAILISNWTF